MMRFDTVVRSRSPCSMRLKRARLVLSQSCSAFFKRLFLEVADHLVDRVLERGHLARRFHRDRAGKVALGHGGRHVGDRAHLVGEVGGELVHVVGQVAPQAGGARHARLAAEPAFDADLAGHVGHLVAEGRQRLDHEVDRLGQRGDLALGVHRQLALEVALRHRGHDVGDAAHLVGEVGRHQVHVVGEILPGAADARHLRLAAELAFGADLAGHAGHFDAKPLSWSTMTLMVSLSARISPFTSTVIFLESRPWPRRWSRRRCCGPGR
jgi:hypothetical protein